MDLTVALLEKRTYLCVVQEEGVFKEYDVTTKSSLYFLSFVLSNTGCKYMSNYTNFSEILGESTSMLNKDRQ